MKAAAASIHGRFTCSQSPTGGGVSNCSSAGRAYRQRCSGEDRNAKVSLCNSTHSCGSNWSPILVTILEFAVARSMRGAALDRVCSLLCWPSMYWFDATMFALTMSKNLWNGSGHLPCRAQCSSSSRLSGFNFHAKSDVFSSLRFTQHNGVSNRDAATRCLSRQTTLAGCHTMNNICNEHWLTTIVIRLSHSQACSVVNATMHS